MLLVKAVRKEKAPNPGDCHGIGASLWDMPLYVEDVVRCLSDVVLYLKGVISFGNIISPCVSIICIRFNGYHLSRFSQHPVIFRLQM